jgi:DNA-binding response OmpR family regulator
MLRMLYARALRRAGHRVHTHERGDDGLRFSLGTKLDLVILDWHLPGLNGFQILTALRDAQRPVRIMMLSGSGADARENAIQAGADAFLEKPCGLDEILAVVNRLAFPQIPLCVS